MIANHKPRAPRYGLNKTLDIYYKSAGVFDTQGLNISESGILLKTLQPIGLYAKVVLRLHLPFETPRYLDLEASTIRSETTENGFLTALEFTETPETDKVVLRRLVEGLSSSP